MSQTQSVDVYPPSPDLLFDGTNEVSQTQPVERREAPEIKEDETISYVVFTKVWGLVLESHYVSVGSLFNLCCICKDFNAMCSVLKNSKLKSSLIHLTTQSRNNPILMSMIYDTFSVKPTKKEKFESIVITSCKDLQLRIRKINNQMYLTYPNSSTLHTPASSPIKKKIKTELFQEEEWNDFVYVTSYTTMNYLASFIFYTIKKGTLNVDTMTVDRITKLWGTWMREMKVSVTETDIQTVNTNLSNLLQINVRQQEEFQIKSSDSFDFEVQIGGKYYIIDNFSGKVFPFYKLALLSTKASSLLILSNSNNRIFDLKLIGNKTPTLQEIIVEDEIEFHSIITQTLSKIQIIGNMEFNKHTKGICGDMSDKETEFCSLDDYDHFNPECVIFTTKDNIHLDIRHQYPVPVILVREF